MTLERILAVRLEKLHQLLPLGHREARADADVLEVALVVVETEKQRSDRGSFSVLVPAESGDDTIRFALVLHLEHRALVRLVEARELFGHHAVEPRALEALEPV